MRSAHRLLAPILALALLRCGGGDLVLPSGQEAESLMAVRGDDQAGAPGTPLSDSLVVRLVNTAGGGVPGRAVTWVVATGGGQVDPENTTTDRDGYASARWTLGPTAGSNTLNAVVSGVGVVRFTATATEDGGNGGGGGTGGEVSASRSTISASPDSITLSGTSTITVTVRDDNGDPIEGATVELQASGGGNTVTQPSSPSGSDGVVVGSLSSTEPGTKEISATVNGSVQVRQTATVTVTARSGVDHFVFRVEPHDVKKGERFSVQVAMVDGAGNVVPLSGIVIYLGLFPEGSDVPANGHLKGERFRATEDGVAVFSDLAVEKKGRYRIRALSDDLPEYGPGGPEPFLFSDLFSVN